METGQIRDLHGLQIPRILWKGATRQQIRNQGSKEQNTLYCKKLKKEGLRVLQEHSYIQISRSCDLNSTCNSTCQYHVPASYCSPATIYTGSSELIPVWTARLSFLSQAQEDQSAQSVSRGFEYEFVAANRSWRNAHVIYSEK